MQDICDWRPDRNVAIFTGGIGLGALFVSRNFRRREISSQPLFSNLASGIGNLACGKATRSEGRRGVGYQQI
jgi:hypothetical protein